PVTTTPLFEGDFRGLGARSIRIGGGQKMPFAHRRLSALPTRVQRLEREQPPARRFARPSGVLDEPLAPAARRAAQTAIADRSAVDGCVHSTWPAIQPRPGPREFLDRMTAFAE